MIVQINGKMRAKLSVDKDTDKDALEKLAMAEPRIQSNIGDKTVRKVIVIPNKIVNIVVG